MNFINYSVMSLNQTLGLTLERLLKEKNFFFQFRSLICGSDIEMRQP